MLVAGHQVKTDMLRIQRRREDMEAGGTMELQGMMELWDGGAAGRSEPF